MTISVKEKLRICFCLFSFPDDANTQTTEHEATPELEEKHQTTTRETVKTEDYKKGNELVSETEQLVPILEIKDQPKEARFEAIAENQEEIDARSKMEEFESALEDQAKRIEPISDTEEPRKETSSIRDNCQKQMEENEEKETKVSDDTLPEYLSEPTKNETEVSQNEAEEKMEMDKKEETKESKVSNDAPPEGETEVLQNETETVEVRGDGFEVLQDERETIARRIISNLSDLASSVDINYVILNSPTAPREIDVPVWDIVDEDTIRTLHNMFAYRSLDVSFDLSRDFYTMEEVLNGRQTVLSSSSSSDDFIFQPGIDFPMNLSMYEHAALRAMIRPRRGLEEDEDDGEDSFCDLCITTIDHEDLAEIDSFEIDDLGDEEIEQIVAEHPIVSELGLNDFLIQMARIWRSLNLRGLLTGVLETLHTLPPNDDRTDIPRSISRDEGEDEETHEGCSLEDERALKYFEEDCLRFVKEDVFTNIEFPVVINLTEAIGDSPEVAFDEEDPEDTELDLDVVLEQAEPSKTNLFSLADDRHEEDVEMNEIGDEDEETRRNEYLKRFSSISVVNSYDAFGRILHEESGASYSKDNILIASRPNKLKNYVLVRSEPVQARKGDLNRTYEVLEEIDAEEELERSIDSEELDEIIIATEDVEEAEKLTRDTDEREEMKKIDKHEDVEEDVALQVAKEDVNVTRVEEYRKETEKSIQLVEFEGEENKTQTSRTSEETFECEDDSLGRTNLEVDDQRLVTLYTILTFWMLVFCFYVRYFYQKIFLFKQASTSTSTLKPFEIHGEPTSTITFLENSILIDQIEEETCEETVETEELEEDDSFDRIVDLEMIDVSKFDEYDSVMNIDSTLYGRTFSNSFRVKELNEENGSKEIEESVVCLRKRILGTIEIRPNEPQEEEEETSVESDSKIQSVFLMLNSTVKSNSESSVVEKPASESSLAIEPMKLEEDSLELRLAAEEIETLRYKDDDDSESRLTSDDETKVRTTNAEIQNIEEIQTGSREAKFVERSSKDEDEEERTSFERTVLSRREVEEAGKQDERSSSEANFMETSLRTNDSFDSTYTAASQVSRSAASAIDLNDSSMEEFAIASNESGESNEGS